MCNLTRYRILKSIKPLYLGKFYTLLGLIVAKIVGLGMSVVIPCVYMLYMKNVLENHDSSLLALVVFLYFAIYLFQSLFISIGAFCENKCRNSVRVGIKKHLLAKFSKISFSEFEKYPIGDIRNRIEVDTIKLQDFLVKHVINFFFSIASIIAFSVVLFALDWKLTLVGFGGVGISVLATRIIGVKINGIANKYRSNMGEFEGSMLYGLHNWKEIKMNNLEQKQMDLLNGKWAKITRLVMKQTILKYLSTALVAVNMFIATRLGIYIFGGLLILNDCLSVSTLLVFIAYYDGLHKEFNSLVQSVVDFRVEKPALELIVDIMSLPSNDKRKDTTIGELQVNHVVFSYNDDVNVIDDVSFCVSEREHVALVGKSGCGKTTVVKMLVGLIEPDSGKITVGNTELGTLSDEARSKVICAVMQEPRFFNLSIAENLRLVRPEISQEEMDEVCKMANIYEFIQSLPDKYDALIGEKGLKLSGVQRQRLAIARTIIRDPQIIIFDEATSSLDQENEKTIINTIQNIAKEKTILTIAHRFATVEFADEIIMLQNGKILAKGTKDELIMKCKEFRALFVNQIA